MSHYRVIDEVTNRLRTMLLGEFTADPVIKNLIDGDEESISLLNPTETAKNRSHSLSLWLYQITENEFVKNQPPLRGNGSGALQTAPLALNLFYLVTPFLAKPEANHQLIGKTMQVLYDNAIMMLRSVVNGEEIAEELRIILCRLTLEELTRIWEALQEPYRLSVCYQVRVTRIDSLRPLTAAPVSSRRGEFSDTADAEAR